MNINFIIKNSLIMEIQEDIELEKKCMSWIMTSCIITMLNKWHIGELQLQLFGFQGGWHYENWFMFTFIYTITWRNLVLRCLAYEAIQCNCFENLVWLSNIQTSVLACNKFWSWKAMALPKRNGARKV